MARFARVVVPGIPHHVTQRGNRRMETFFGEGDYVRYIGLLAEHCAAAEVQVWAYCLMPNHVHLIMVPADGDGLRRALGPAHRRYTRHVNLREDWRGHLWQERFHSFPMDEAHLLACARYVEQNPVRAGMVLHAKNWPWSSARAHLAGQDDHLVTVAPLLERVGNWAQFLDDRLSGDAVEEFRAGSRTGRPLGPKSFVAEISRATGRDLKPKQRGRPWPAPQRLI